LYHARCGGDRVGPDRSAVRIVRVPARINHADALTRIGARGYNGSGRNAAHSDRRREVQASVLDYP
jgi:hypothetical protein